MNVKAWITKYFYDKDLSSNLNNVDILNFNYIESNFLNSIEFIELIAKLEDTFAISLSNLEMQSVEFRTIGGLICITERKVAENNAQSCLN